jgi:hypothetical protein
MDWRGGVPREDRAPKQAADLPVFPGALSGQTWIVATAWLCNAYREVGCWRWLLGVDDKYGNGTCCLIYL